MEVHAVETPAAVMAPLCAKTGRQVIGLLQACASISAFHARLTLGSADHLQFADNSFDKVYSINCIYFWPAPARGLSELYRVVKRGGLVAITVRDKERPPYDAFRPEKLTNSLIEAGFSSVAINRNDVPSHPLICAVGTT
ncbi:class I SAM-dependent methyltransferase [Paraburkholderia denitrificans]|uniref:Class I SAM-dependent methyltransferase n=1 Tax=Paraburkholderia denitrificans TaxID=694025 RepID=A0ABW0J2U8_9BURK